LLARLLAVRKNPIGLRNQVFAGRVGQVAGARLAFQHRQVQLPGIGIEARIAADHHHPPARELRGKVLEYGEIAGAVAHKGRGARQHGIVRRIEGGVDRGETNARGVRIPIAQPGRKLPQRLSGQGAGPRQGARRRARRHGQAAGVLATAQGPHQAERDLQRRISVVRHLRHPIQQQLVDRPGIAHASSAGSANSRKSFLTVSPRPQISMTSIHQPGSVGCVKPTSISP